MPGSEDRISALPDGVLQHVLGFLEAGDAVRTSVLAGRWRHAWRSIRRLHVSPDGGWKSAEDLRGLFDTLLFPGDHGSILEEVKMDFDGFGMEAEDDLHVKVWIQQILSGRVQVLYVNFAALENPHMVSRYLRKLKLTEVDLRIKHLDFASCPALEDLKIAHSCLFTDKISSQSVKRLKFYNTDFTACQGSVCRPTISVPSVVWLQLDLCSGIPLLESMPLLKTAFVKPIPYSDSEDRCEISVVDEECCGICAKCTASDDHNTGCVLLRGLSSAVNLELIAHKGLLTLRRDLRRCPTFSNLKTLLLNDWCVVIDSRSLVCMLEHSPVLEKLTLQLSEEPTTVLEGNYYPLENLPAISKHLHVVEIKCRVVDGRVCRILELMSRFVNVTQINIKLVTEWSTCFSFEK